MKVAVCYHKFKKQLQRIVGAPRPHCPISRHELHCAVEKYDGIYAVERDCQLTFGFQRPAFASDYLQKKPNPKTV